MDAKNKETISGHFVTRKIFPARAIMPIVRRAALIFIIDLQIKKRNDQEANIKAKTILTSEHIRTRIVIARPNTRGQTRSASGV